MDNNVSFKSNIYFINNKQYKKIINIAKCPEIVTADGSNILHDTDFITNNIRTCTAGNFTNKSKQNLGFHFIHNIISKELSILSNATKSEDIKNGLIIGSKSVPNEFLESLSNYKKIRKILKKRTNKLTEFKQHNYIFSESSFHYSKKYDSYRILSRYYEENPQAKDQYIAKDVTSLKDLLKCFKKIKIAKGDSLYIGYKQIKPKDYPFIFKDSSIKDYYFYYKKRFQDKFRNRF